MPRLELQDRTQLNFDDWGQGRPVVLLHGQPLSGAMWGHQAVALAESGCRVVAYDRLGFGRSSHPWSGDDDTLSGDLAPRADLPTLVVHGNEDETVPIDSTARALETAVPSVELVAYEGAPHKRLIGFLTASSAA